MMEHDPASTTATVSVQPAPRPHAPDACTAECGLCGMGAYAEHSLTQWAAKHSEQCPRLHRA
ncbi:hypothetical protein [Streptomyces sp. NPDC052811]|uniref:hypothetical protein n=1 Tax=Streptomyces sp. NPDC052811 TaxID=3155731 RepID=UPI0034419DCD